MAVAGVCMFVAVAGVCMFVAVAGVCMFVAVAGVCMFVAVAGVCGCYRCLKCKSGRLNLQKRKMLCITVVNMFNYQCDTHYLTDITKVVQ